MPLKSLDEFNESARNAHKVVDQLYKPRPNGIACPQCGSELWDSSPHITLTSSPPQKNIHCPACGYYGYRIA